MDWHPLMLVRALKGLRCVSCFFNGDFYMSIRKTNIALAAALAASITLAGQTAEPMLDNIANITVMKIVEVDAKGACVLFYTVGTSTKVVTDLKGDVRVYGGSDLALAAVKRSGVGSAVDVSIRKFDPVVNVGNPVQSLINSHKSAVREATSALTNQTTVNTAKTAAEAQDWDTQVGTPQRAEYDDIVQRLAVVTEWKTSIDARVTALAASLTAANISPVTYLPIP